MDPERRSDVLETLLDVSARLAAPAGRQELVRAVCDAVRGLGFRGVDVSLLEDVEPQATLAELEAAGAGELRLPLLDAEGDVVGVIRADRGDAGDEQLRALRVVANLAASALVAGRDLAELRFLADHDPLTRLLNRRTFMARLEAEVARAVRYGRPLGLVVADLDDFKALNDRFGHATGDEALQRFAAVLTRVLRRPDDAFRIGGDEFALVLAEASDEDALEVVRRTQELLDGGPDERPARVTASFGCASCPEDAVDATSLFRLADAALYEAKRSGAAVRFATAS